MTTQTDLYIRLVGMFRLSNSDNFDIKPRGQKACALIAMLATAPDFARPKSWLMDHLWSDRAPEQASGSLRQALREIRVALGDLQDILKSDHSAVHLDSSRIWVDILDQDYLTNLLQKNAEEPEFLFDINIRDAEFEHWVRDRRNYFAEQFKLHEIRTVHNTDQAPNERELASFVVVRGSEDGSDEKRRIFSEILSDLVCKGISDSGSVEIVDPTAAVRPNVKNGGLIMRLDCRAFKFEGYSGAGLRVTNDSDGRIFLNTVRNLEAQKELSLEQQDILHLVNEAVDLSIKEYAKLYPQVDDVHCAASLCFEAVEKMFNLEKDQLLEADALLQEAFELDPRAIYLAWRAYLRTFILGEMPDVCKESTLNEMQYFVRHSIEMEPANSMVLALNSFVYSMWLLDHSTALDMARKSVSINPANPLGIAYLGIVNSHLGNLEEGYQLTKKAMSVSSIGPHRHVMNFVASSAAAYAGHHDEAIRLGELLRERAPKFGAQLRLLTLLYSKTGQMNKTEETVQDLQKIEPGFSVDLMKEGFYRSAILRKSELMSGI